MLKILGNLKSINFPFRTDGKLMILGVLIFDYITVIVQILFFPKIQYMPSFSIGHGVG